MQLWGGIECTLNRVGSDTFDQLARCGHYARGDDLDRIAALGIRTLRYPLLWERAATGVAGVNIDWAFADERLARLQALGITPIAGLVHHGSGPPGADFTTRAISRRASPTMPAQLARRFPWLEWYTPVNEPLTTARFSGLYGHWYPHERSGRAFAAHPDQRMPRHGAGDAGDPRRQSGGAPGADRRPRHDLQHAGARATRRISRTSAAGLHGTCSAAASTRSIPCMET